jgi:type VI secretion system secreted protein Hcp
MHSSSCNPEASSRRPLYSWHPSPFLMVGMLLLGLLVADSPGSSDMFLSIPGIPGESTNKIHSGEIDIFGWSWGATNTGAVVSGGGGAGKLVLGKLELVKKVDNASPLLLFATCNGKTQDTAVLTVRRAGSAPFEYLKIILSDVLVTSVQAGGSTMDDQLRETITLSFAKILVEYTQQKPDGSAGAKVTMSWDLLLNKP